ncbi:MAG: radical SAM protein, partial [Nitrospirota bacterium]
MNLFDQKLKAAGQSTLKADRTDTLVVNFGTGNNVRDLYYYSEALQMKRGSISLDTINRILDVLKDNSGISLVEITGVSPETNHNFNHFVKSAAALGKKLAVVTNPAVYTESGMEDMPAFLARNKVKILAFVPHYDASIVDKYTSAGTHDKIIAGMKRINSAGIGVKGSDLTVAFVYLPAEPEPARKRDFLLARFREEYTGKHDIHFNHFIVFNTIPIGRFDHKNY